MKKWIFILVALSLSPLYIATTSANTAQPSLKPTAPPLTDPLLLTDLVKSPIAGLQIESYFHHHYKKQTAWHEVYRPQQRCNVQLSNEARAIWCEKGIAAVTPLQLDKQSDSTSKRAEAHPDDQVFEIILPKHKPQSFNFLGQQITQQTHVSLLQQVSPLLGIALSCLLIVITVALFHWRETIKSRANTVQNQSK